MTITTTAMKTKEYMEVFKILEYKKAIKSRIAAITPVNQKNMASIIIPIIINIGPMAPSYVINASSPDMINTMAIPISSNSIKR